MKLFKPFFTLLIISILASCNTPNRPKIIDVEPGTPTNADTVLLRKQMNPSSVKHAIPYLYWR